MKLERTLFDKWVFGAFMNKRQIGRPLKYNIRTKEKLGYTHFFLSFYPKYYLNLHINFIFYFLDGLNSSSTQGTSGSSLSPKP
jgi:hypothetical protein